MCSEILQLMRSIRSKMLHIELLPLFQKYQGVTRRGNIVRLRFSNAFSFGKAPFFVTLRKPESALSKLSQMTDEEFDALELYPDFDA